LIKVALNTTKQTNVSKTYWLSTLIRLIMSFVVQ
jgi:hypothetical protein